MQAGVLGRLKSGNAVPSASDYQEMLLAAQSPQRMDAMVRESQGHVEGAEPGHFSTVTVRATDTRTGS